MVGTDETAKSRCTEGSPMKLPVHNNLKMHKQHESVLLNKTQMPFKAIFALN